MCHSLSGAVSPVDRGDWSEMQEMIPPCTELSADLSMMSLSRLPLRQAAAAKAAAEMIAVCLVVCPDVFTVSSPSSSVIIL